jgi:hypothetical protein
MESLPDLNSPEWSQMFGDSTFQFSFNDVDDNGEPIVEVNADLPVALARSHNAVSTAMDKHRPSIPLPIVPVAEEPLQPAASLPILVETVDEPSLIVSPPREPPSHSPREPSSPSPREPINPGNVRWKMPLDTCHSSAQGDQPGKCTDSCISIFLSASVSVSRLLQSSALEPLHEGTESQSSDPRQFGPDASRERSQPTDSSRPPRPY